MATLTAQSIVQTGLEATYASAAGGGDEFANNDGKKKIIHIKNGDASDMTLTIVTQNSVGGLAVADQTVVVTGTEERFVGPFNTGYFNDGDGNVQLTYSAVTSVTIAILDIS